MPDRPLLILPRPGEPLERRKKFGGGGRVHRPDPARQAERLVPRFEQLQQALESRRTRLQTEAQGLMPEEVIVLETVGTVEDFIRAVEKIPGMEWLGELQEEDIPPDDDFFAVGGEDEQPRDKPLQGRLFMIFTNQEALRQMLSLWQRWQSGEKLPHGLGRWRILFEQLRDVRVWGVQDRLLETGVLDDWQDRVDHDQEVVPCEIELWYRQAATQRATARERVAGLVAGQDGQVVAEATIEEISYHALLVRLPIQSVRTVLEGARDTALIQCEQIQFFRASGQMSAVLPDDERQTEEWTPQARPPDGAPIVALFDGLPLQRHARLDGRLIIDDPDDFESDYPATERRHGTAMASLIVHGDLSDAEQPLIRPLYVRPILKPDARDWRRPREETVPEDMLIVDLLHRAVRRLFEGEGDDAPVAPDVAVINLSIGIRDRLFDNSLSPLARLLDWLAWQYKVLFVVSAGNHPRPIELEVPSGDVTTLAPDELERNLIRSIAADARNRRLLSPAEAVNVITAGATHHDASTGGPPPQWIHPYANPGLPSLINAQGMGYRRAIKPEVMAPGGRVVIQEDVSSNGRATVRLYDRTLAPGQLAAAPGRAAGDRDAMWHMRGTSNSAALLSRSAAECHDTLDELRSDPGGDIIDIIPRSIWLKTLVAHAADWGPAGTVLDGVLRNDDNSRQFKEYLTRLLGYGNVDGTRVRECTEHRVTALGGGVIARDQSHIHQLPLPPSLSGVRGLRRLIISLAWLTPVNTRHQAWRRADLWFGPPADPLRVTRSQADWRAVQRGTLQHEILEGQEAAVFVDGSALEIQVSCRADAGDLQDQVPYALAITLEVADDIGIEIYEELRERVRERVRVAAVGGASWLRELG